MSCSVGVGLVCNTCVRESGDVRIRELNSGNLDSIVSGIECQDGNWEKF